MRGRKKIRELYALINRDRDLEKWMDEYRQLMGETGGA
jgi:hypothetical protein